MKTILVMATTLDGKIGRGPLHHVDWTGKKDKKLFVHLTREAGVVIMGSNTYKTIGKALPGRKNIVMTRNPSQFPGANDLLFTDQAPHEIIRDLESQGYDSAALIGGAVVNSLFLEEKLIDELYVTIVPRLFGTGLSMFSEAVDIGLELLNKSDLDEGSILIKY
ncbi:MAG: dihydrofolate reductase, partial [Desulfobacteraceae bacterium]